MHTSRIILLLGLTYLCAGQPGDSLPPGPPEADIESRNEVMPVFLAHEYRNDRPLFGLVDDCERERRKQTRDRVLEIRGYLTELFSVPENARDLQWSTNTMNLLVEYVPTLQMFQLGGIPLRNMRLDVMRRILDDGADDMIHGNNAIFPLMDTLYFVIEEINLWLDENPIIENRMNHQQLQNAEGEEVPGIPGDEGVNALVINRLLNITAVDILVEAPPAEELPVRHVAVNMPRITDDDRRNEAATVIPRNPSSGAIVVDTPVEASLVRQSDWCSQSEMIVYLCIIVFVALWVAYQVVCRFRNNPRR